MLIKVNNVSKDYQENDNRFSIFSNINLEINQSSTYAIVGSSGVGKTTLLHLIGGLDHPSSGTILYLDNNTTQKHSTFAYIFQEHNLLPELTVAENIMLPLLISGYDWQKARDKIKVLLQTLGLENLSTYYLHQLSGGQRQRIAVVRAVAQSVKFILADEPSANLDQDNAKLIIDLLLNINKAYDIGIILCSHDPSIFSRMEYQIRILDKKVTLIKN